MEVIELIIENIVPIVIFLVLAGFGIYQYVTKGQIDKKLIDLTTELATITLEKAGILAFFDADKSISETSYETLNSIPANTWRMNDENRNLVLDSCATQAERMDIDALIDSYEVSSVYGDVQKIYHITTAGRDGGVWRVEYGIPTLVTPNWKSYTYLSDEQKEDICKHVSDPIAVLNEIAHYERECEPSYSIDSNGTIIDVFNGEVTITKV